MSELTAEEIRDARIRNGTWTLHRYGDEGGGGLVIDPRGEGPDNEPGTTAAANPETLPGWPLTAAKAACFVEKIVS
jgi:hypothetical protein